MLPASVRYLHSPQWRAVAAKQKIRAYFEALGLPGDLAIEPIAERLRDRFSDQWAAFGEAVFQRENGFDREDIYEQKNSSLEFSLLAGAAFRGAIHRAVMRWVAERAYFPSAVLDVGCDNGILTCFYALLWPAATITGIDISAAGIIRAQELATALRLTNVSFLTKSIEDFAAPEANGQFSLVLTTTVIHEAGYFAPMESDHWFIDEAFNAKSPESFPPFFGIVASLLSAKEGRWLGAECVLTPHLLWRWAEALQAAGLRLESDACARLKCDDALLSILVAGRGQGERATPAWATAYWTREKLPAFGPKTRLPAKFSGLVAQFVLDSIPDRHRVAVARRWDKSPPPSGREWERIEIWLTDTLAILFRTNANMVMELHLLEIRELSIARENWESIARGFQDSGCRFERQIDL